MWRWLHLTSPQERGEHDWINDISITDPDRGELALPNQEAERLTRDPEDVRHSVLLT
jgi:hypothetical protein